MLHLPVGGKPYAIYSAAVVFTGLIVFLVLSSQLEKEATSQTWAALEEKADLGREAVQLFLEASPAGQPHPEIQPWIGRWAGAAGVRVTVIAADGTVLADSSRSPASMSPHLYRPEILAVRSHQQGRSIRRSETLGVDMVYFALPLAGGQDGYLRTAIPVSHLEDRLDRRRKGFLVGVGLVVVAALGSGLLLIGWIARPLGELRRTAEALARGDFDQQSRIAGEGDVGRLSGALNQIGKTAKKSLEDARIDRNRFVAVLAGMVEGVLAVDRDERVIQVNEAAARILGKSLHQIMGQPIWEVTRVREVCESLALTLRTSSDLEMELRMASPHQDREVRMRTAPLRDGEGHLVGALLVLNDVSHLQKLERVRRDFVANVSHEFKTPIAAIQGLVETLIDDKEMSPEIRQRFLAKIRNQAGRLSTIASDLLSISRLESSEVLLDRRLLDLRKVVETSSRDVLQVEGKQEVQVEILLPDYPVFVDGDAKGLAQVTSNLLGNALKYTPPGGRVWVRLEIRQNQAVLEVEDTGVGIEPRQQGRIFERFYRVDKARSRAVGGTGLGLSIVRHVAMVHNGSVSVKSTPGRGSTFTLSIPIVDPPTKTQGSLTGNRTLS